MQYVVTKIDRDIFRIHKGEDALTFERQWCEVFTMTRHQPWEVYEVSEEEYNKLYQEIKEINRKFAYERYGIKPCQRWKSYSYRIVSIVILCFRK